MPPLDSKSTSLIKALPWSPYLDDAMPENDAIPAEVYEEEKLMALLDMRLRNVECLLQKQSDLLEPLVKTLLDTGLQETLMSNRSIRTQAYGSHRSGEERSGENQEENGLNPTFIDIDHPMEVISRPPTPVDAGCLEKTHGSGTTSWSLLTRTYEASRKVHVKPMNSFNFVLRESWETKMPVGAPRDGGGTVMHVSTTTRVGQPKAAFESQVNTDDTHPAQKLFQEATAAAQSSQWWCRFCHWLYFDTIIPPQSPLQVFWELSGVFIVLFDMFELPLQVFDPPKGSFVVIMAWVAQLFWNVDLLVSFRMGYMSYEDSVVEPCLCAKHYIKTWFLFDLIIVLIDWVLYAQEATENSPLFAKAGKTFKAFRTVRTMKLLRVMKLRKAFHAVEEHVVQVVAGCHTPIMGICKFLFAIMTLCHFLCSVWFMVGRHSGAEGWVDRFDVQGLPFWTKYLMTFHWSLTQFGVGESNISGDTALEYLCNIAILLSGLVFSALLVSSVTNTFSILQQQTADQFHQMWLLRRFCVEYEFPRSLSKRVVTHVDSHLSGREMRTDITDVKLLGRLSAPLYAEVLFHVYLPPLSSHPFLAILCKDDSYTMREVATGALRELVLADNDLVFIRGAQAMLAYTIMTGKMSYETDTLGEASEKQEEVIGAPRWIGEPVLWTEWFHHGDLYANEATRCLTIDSAKFCETVCMHADTLLLVRMYAQGRVEELRSLPMEDLTNHLRSSPPQLQQAAEEGLIGAGSCAEPSPQEERAGPATGGEETGDASIRAQLTLETKQPHPQQKLRDPEQRL